MAITLTPAPFDSHAWLAGDHLRVAGDVEATLIIPVARPRDLGDGHVLTESYYIAVSDGTMIRATNDPERPDFVIEFEGPSGVTFSADGLSLSIPGDVKWVALASNQGGHAFGLEPIETAPLFAGA
ncbi:MAG TPA: hypothetical protein VNS34_21630 [Rhizobiaceae bacterium]|nr:hypothetical protein [Rhizobiaceae bacterium]